MRLPLVITKRWATKTTRGLRRSERDYSIEHRCYEKTVFPDWVSAEAQIIRLVNRDAADGRQWRSMGLGAYRCPHCSDWHIGHSRGPNIGFFAGLHPEKAKARGKVG